MKVPLEQIPQIVKVLVETGRQDEARNAADSFLKHDHHDPTALFWRGCVNEETGDLQAARMDFATAATVMPHHPLLREAARRSLEKSGNAGGWSELQAMLDREASLNGGFQTMPSIEPVTWLEKTIYVPRFPLRDPIAMHIRAGKIHDRPVYETLKDFISPGDTVLDVGANFGLMSTLFADLVGKDGKVYSFEANPYNFHILSLNMKTNGLTQVEPVFRAVMDVSEQTLSFPPPDFSIYPSHGSFSVSPDKDAGYPITSITIDAMNIERHIGAMKVDIQGADLLALRGAVETIKRHRMPILVEYEEDLQKPFGTGFQDYVDFTASIGYRFDKVVDSINFLLLPR
jgi:FkbM family methyltransferase